MQKWVSRTETSVLQPTQDEIAFGLYAPARCWRRGTGGGYHDPAPSKKFGESMEFKRWMDKWTDPSSTTTWRLTAAPRSDSPAAFSTSGSHSRSKEVPTLDFRTTSALPALDQRPAPKAPIYPNPGGWKHQTSLPSRTPGFVGSLRTR
eukprot:Skav224067  [mRNA]  locus=scaffold432:17822:28988:+ [translate_table: standard]